MNITTIIGISASIFTATSMLPQMIKLMKEKKAEHVSLAMIVVLFIGLALWVYYGILLQDAIIIVANSFSLIVSSVTGILSIKYKSK